METTMIARIWRGRTTRARADEYEAYNLEHGVKPLEKLAVAVQRLRQDHSDYSVFVTISYWRNVDDMARFTGRDPRAIHHLPRDPEFLIELPEAVEIFEIRGSQGLSFGG